MLTIALMSLALSGHLVCDDEHESAECAAELMASAERNLSLPPIQAEFSAGAQVYRAVFDGGRHDTPAVSFERRPGRSPELVLYGTGGQTLRREIGPVLWEAVQNRSRYVGRKLEPSGGSISCVVSSDVVVQVSRPRMPRPDRDAHRSELFAVLDRGGVIEASQNSCEGGLTWDYGAFLADIACDEIPACEAMGPHDQLMQSGHNLGAVFRLHGDKLAAARLSATKGWAPSRGRHDQPVGAERFAQWLAPETGATLHWGDTTITADSASRDAIPAALAEQDAVTGGLGFAPDQFGADSADVGWVTGKVSHSVEVDGTWRVSEAPYRQTWLRSGDDWRLWSMTVGDFSHRAVDADEPDQPR